MKARVPKDTMSKRIIALFLFVITLKNVGGFSSGRSVKLPKLQSEKQYWQSHPRPGNEKWQSASDVVMGEYHDGSISISSREEEINGSEVSGGSASIPSEVFNIVKSIIGAGVLSLPAGIAAYGSSASALIPSMALIGCVGAISGYCFSLVGRVCSYTGAQSYRSAWAKTVGERSSWIPAASCTLDTFCGILAYSMILSDTVKNLLAGLGIATSRSNALFGITGLVLLPLCLMKNLSSLAPFSLLGIAGMLYTAIAMSIRYFGSAYALPSGHLLPALAPNLQPSFSASHLLNPKIFILICMLSTSYMAHWNAPKFYNELKNNTLNRYNKVVTTSFIIAVALCLAIGSLGFLTFGASCDGCILNNYAATDSLMSFSRVGVALSLIFSYPLAFIGVRDGVLDLAKIPETKRTPKLLNALTAIILTFTTTLALKVKDVSLVLAMDGAIVGNAIIYVFPALMFRRAIKTMPQFSANKRFRREKKFALLSASMGVVMGILGATFAMKGI